MGGDWVFWAVLLLPSLALLAGVSVRRVGRDELVLVVRRGRVARSGVTGFVTRVPGLERFVAVPTHRQVLPLVVRAPTRDGVEIVALADLVLAVESVPTGRRTTTRRAPRSGSRRRWSPRRSAASRR